VVYQETRFFQNASMEVESPFVVQIYPGVLDPLAVLYIYICDDAY
jgi:hypothetical protein